MLSPTEDEKFIVNMIEKGDLFGMEKYFENVESKH